VIDPSALRAAKPLSVPLPLLKLMDQSRYGVIRVMEEAQAHPLIVATLRFIQLQEPLLPLKLMDQSRQIHQL
jgi:hypothetical protein